MLYRDYLLLNVTFNPNNTDLDIGYEEKSKPGVRMEFLVETSGSKPVYFVKVHKLCPVRYTFNVRIPAFLSALEVIS